MRGWVPAAGCMPCWGLVNAPGGGARCVAIEMIERDTALADRVALSIAFRNVSLGKCSGLEQSPSRCQLRGLAPRQKYAGAVQVILVGLLSGQRYHPPPHRTATSTARSMCPPLTITAPGAHFDDLARRAASISATSLIVSPVRTRFRHIRGDDRSAFQHFRGDKFGFRLHRGVRRRSRIHDGIVHDVRKFVSIEEFRTTRVTAVAQHPISPRRFGKSLPAHRVAARRIPSWACVNGFNALGVLHVKR